MFTHSCIVPKPKNLDEFCVNLKKKEKKRKKLVDFVSSTCV